MADISSNYVKFLRGTPSAYNALSVKDKDTLYFVAETNAKSGKLYIGDVLASGNVSSDGQSIIDSLGELTDVSLVNLANKDLLGYDARMQKWIPMSIDEIFTMPIFTGASNDQNGIAGLVPAPKIGETSKFLRGDGTWAEVKNGTEAQIFQTTINKGADHIQAIQEIVGDNDVSNGDIVIVKEIISEENQNYNIYLYNDSNWIAINSNYNAENVYFDQNLVITSNVGVQKIDSSGAKTLETQGKSVKQVFDMLFTEEKNPQITQPTVVITSSQIKSYEVGTSIMPSYSLNLDTGLYSYGPQTNVQALSYKAVNSNGEILEQQSGTFNELIVSDQENYKITGIIEYSDGVIPKTNLGNEYIEGQIKAGSKSNTSNAITGYRSSFIYIGEDNTSLINSEFIRKAINKNANTKNFGTVVIPKNTKRILFAVPGSANLESCIDIDGMGLDIKDNFNKLTVPVEGVNGYTAIDYTIFVFENSNGLSATRYTPTII